MKEMTAFKLAFVTLLLGVGTASGQSSSGDYEAIVGFTPLTDVRDQLRIDLDQQKIEELLELETDEGFAAAQKLYIEGSFSKTVSNLTVSAGLPIDLPQKTTLVGVGTVASNDTTAVSKQDSGSVEVFAYQNYTTGDTEIRVQYINEGCYVGANPDPVIAGCLADNGTLAFANDTSTTFEYTYNALEDTGNVYSIQLFTNSDEYNFEDDVLTVDFKKFVDFYGSESYADDIIIAAFEGGKTSFSTGKDLDMSNYDLVARAEIISKASAYMAVWMYVVRELEHAIYLCETGDCDENSCFGKPAVHEVDEAVAFYAGSLEGTDGSGDGVLTYNLADNRASDFKTAGENGDSIEGTAKVNIDLLEEFKKASDHIVNAECASVRDDTTRIVQLMTIPLIQGTLRYAYFTGEQNDTTQKSEAEGAIFAASVLPFVAACNEADAEIIYENTKTGQANSANFTAVKDAFERNYECMGVTPADVGGLWDTETNDYFPLAAPPGTSDGGTSEGGTSNGGTSGGALGFSTHMALGVSLVVSLSSFIRAF